jgi:hypothetical protein
MITQELLDEIRSRAGDQNLQDSVLLQKVNAEWDQTNLEITNLNEDYFYEESAVVVTTSVGPYTFPATFAKLRGLFRPDETLVPQRRPTDRKQRYGWYLAGTTVAGLKQFKFTETPDVAGNYICAAVLFPPHLSNTGTVVNPTLWPAPFHEVLILGALKRLYSVEDIWEKFSTLAADLKELREGLLAQVGSLNLGTARRVVEEEQYD